MAKILNKDPVTYEKERENFLKDLRHFHETRGTLFKKTPKINGKDIDLYLLYVVVTAHGGWIKVNTRNEWASLCEQFHLPGGCINSGVGLKQIYLRYLDRYEKVHFLGEDGQQADDDDEDSRHRKWSARALHSVPLTYNHHQHNIAESLRDYNGLSADLYKSSNYDKLALSLLSPLPNEQDFAINVCTLLSNEGKHTLRLDKYPRLVNILLAHAGVFDSPGTRQLFIEVYSRVRNYSINSFWSDVLDSQDVIDLTNERTFMKKPPSSLPTFSRRKTLEKEKQSKQDVAALATENEEPTLPIDVEVVPPDCPRLDSLVLHSDENLKDQNQNSIKFEEEDKDLFCVGRTLGTQDPYGQRVLQIASILRNLSFTPENATVLGRNRCFLRFVLLCVRARWSNLHQLGFDILGNIANEVILKEAGERITDVVLTCVAKGIESQDRFIVISCLEVLNKISQQDSNEEIVTFGLADNVYELICRFLALSDIALLVHTLECLYALTSLGERPCTSVARVRGAIDTLVALVTVEAQSYGPKACILMRVVETVSTAAAAQQNTTGQAAVPATPTTPATTTASASTPSTPATITATPAPASPASSRPTTPAATSTKSTTHKAVETANAIQQQTAHQQIIQENEQFALGWVKATFELAPGIRIEQEELYKKYLGCCTKIGRRGVIAPLHFPRCVRSVFGNIVGPNPLKGENTGTQYYEGIRVRATPAPITYPSQTTAAVATNTLPIPAVNTTPVKVLPVQQRTVKNISPAPDSTAAPQVDSSAASSGTQTTSTPASPILKAQLSAPPKPPSNNTSSQSQNPVTKVDSKSQVSVSHPHLSQALLASGSQTPQQQQQTQPQQQLQCVQVVAKEDNRSGTTSSSIIKSLLATKVTVSSDCMPSAAATCVSTPTACVTNTTASIASSISANQLITSNQVAQRQQQQRLLQQQMTGVMQPAAPAATPATILPKTPVNAKQKLAIAPIPAKKIQRLNGAKFVVTNNCEKTEVNDNDNANQMITSTTTVVNSTENHISSSPAKICRPPLTTTVNVATATPNKTNQRMTCTSIGEDSDSTNNSLASSSGIGGSRDCSFRVEEENMPTSFEGILLNGAPASNNTDIDAQEDGSSKDSSSVSSKDKPLQSMMLVDLLERKVDKEPILNGVLCKNSINEKEMDLVENHIKKVLKESPTELKMKPDVESGNVIQNEVSEDTLIEAPRGIKRSASESDELDIKKPKYSNGTMSPDPAVDSTTAESTVSSIKSEEQDDDKDSEKATVSSTAANLYAALAADCIEDEMDLEEQVNVNKDTIKDEALATATAPTTMTATATTTATATATATVAVAATATVPMAATATVAVATATPASLPPPLHVKTEPTPVLMKEEPPTIHIKEEPHIFINQIASAIATNQASQPQAPPHQQQQQQLIVATPRQIVVQQTIPTSNQVIIPTTSMVKGRPPPPQPQVLLQQSAGGQLQYVVSGGVPGQNYVLAQPQTALVQGQAQTVLVAQTTQQQGTGTKTIIILQPQAAAQPTPQKMVAVTPQGQQVVVTQVPRPILQSPALGNIPPPLVPTSATIPQASIIVNSSVAQTNPNTVTVTIPAMAQQTPISTSVPSRVVTPTPASTPPPTRPTTPHQAAATHGVSAVKPSPTTKVVKTVSSSTSTESESKPSTSQQQQTPQPLQENKTITIKIDPNAYLCEWRGCLRQFKTPHEVYLHVCEAHCPTGGEEILCLWSSCDALKRRKFSLMTHLYDRHCNADTMSMRRKQLTATGKTEVSTSTPPTPHHPGYAPNAAFHAIKRHALEFVNPKELMQRPTKPAAATTSSSSPRPGQNSPPEQDDNEGPVTKSIRLTAALILRNLVIYSTHGRRHLRAYEPHLAGVALSNVESSRTIAQVLYDMNDQSSSSHHR